MGTAGAAQAVSVNTAGVLSDTLERHGSRLRGYDHRQKGADLWIDLNGHASKASRYSAGNTRYGYKSEMAGATIGMDLAHGNGFTTGAALSFGTGTARGQGNGGGTHNEIDYWGFHFYGIYTHDPFNLIGRRLSGNFQRNQLAGLQGRTGCENVFCRIESRKTVGPQWNHDPHASRRAALSAYRHGQLFRRWLPLRGG